MQLGQKDMKQHHLGTALWIVVVVEISFWENVELVGRPTPSGLINNLLNLNALS